MLRRYRLEIALAISVAALVLQLAAPAIDAYQNRPRPGRLVQQTLRADEAASFPQDYLLYLPPVSVVGDWPVVVFLHGSGERERDADALRNVLPMSIAEERAFPFLLVAPHCPRNDHWRDAYVLPVLNDLAERFPIDRGRVYLVGYSMGGYGTWRLAAKHPERFAALVPIAGGGDASEAATLATIPVWAFHGEKDRVVPASEGQSMIDAVRKQGGDARLSLLGGSGHGICGEVFAKQELFDWLLQHERAGD